MARASIIRCEEPKEPDLREHPGHGGEVVATNAAAKRLSDMSSPFPTAAKFIPPPPKSAGKRPCELPSLGPETRGEDEARDEGAHERASAREHESDEERLSGTPQILQARRENHEHDRVRDGVGSHTCMDGGVVRDDADIREQGCREACKRRRSLPFGRTRNGLRENARTPPRGT